MVKSRVKLEGLLKLIKTMEQDYYHPVRESEEYKTYCAEYKAIETDLEKLRGKRNLIIIIVPRSERPFKVVISGLPRDLNVDVLKKELVEEYEFVVDKVVQLTRFKTKEPLELFQVTLPNIEVNKGIWKITSLLYLKIKVVKVERKTGSIQCFNCNYWHHSTATCGFKPRCIKCGGQHAKDECTNPPETVTCINCKQEGQCCLLSRMSNVPQIE
ncbi:hypothetical protein AVEN_176473-1 [Araneus ventricosus]|uniref:Pre-C2HC domain-containing protein n=1 Tax=Araneus ventricosus TaxID=182803 RepID=A0A4Y2JKA4_ARAVE|nr:hypothetical protein AVEN_176473-1 [Araneus ventricosus]